ncbi:cadherin-like domain-containing protein, partial [Thiomicrorhabdus cannonii]|uniref:cadherin-like domain-containing protein n=1 Tax=Thiomicrorhabdus cannonii TaxID=2748011 RepID=UPI0015BA229D
QPAHGNVVIEGDGTVTYTPVADYNGPDSFTYTITDGQGGTDTAMVTLTVNPQNDPPVALDDVSILDEDSSANIDVLANDSDL